MAYVWLDVKKGKERSSLDAIKKGLKDPAHGNVELKESYILRKDPGIADGYRLNFNVALKVEADSKDSLQCWFLDLDHNYEGITTRLATLVLY